jgi:DNA topoisomerase-1
MFIQVPNAYGGATWVFVPDFEPPSISELVHEEEASERTDHDPPHRAPLLRVDNEKQTKAEVDYGPGMPESHCSICTHFIAPDACHLVQGEIDGEDWCRLFDKAARGDDATFRESEHPRDEDGKFAEGGGAGKSAPKKLEATTRLESGLATADGKPLPEHIAALKIPPAWTDVHFSPDPNAALQVTGKDAKGRRTSIYSAEHTSQAAAAKYSRIRELSDKFNAIKKQNDAARKNPETRDAADCLALVMAMGIRPGSERDTGAEKQAYGATTLQGKHVRVTAGGKVSLQFTGKKGVALNLPVTDPDIAKMLLKRKDQAGPTGQLFDITDADLRDHTHSMDGGGFKTKDFRTHLGTSTAMQMVEKTEEPPDNPRAYKRAVLAVAKEVSTRLGNTPAIALQSYINPVVFAEWRQAAGV